VRTRPRSILIALSILLFAASRTSAQIVVTPFASVNAGTIPGFFDLDDAAKKLHGGIGVSVSVLTDGWIGVEGETVFTSSAFSGHDLVESSGLLTASGGAMVTAPARWARRLRPYVSLGAGVAQINSVDVGHFFVVDSSVPVGTGSVGAWLWFSHRVGLRANLRFLRSLRTVESEPLETWQPSVGVSWRF
jgi:outer membrane protein with beta-barrel domain